MKKKPKVDPMFKHADGSGSLKRRAKVAKANMKYKVKKTLKKGR